MAGYRKYQKSAGAKEEPGCGGVCYVSSQNVVVVNLQL